MNKDEIVREISDWNKEDIEELHDDITALLEGIEE